MSRGWIPPPSPTRRNRINVWILKPTLEKDRFSAIIQLQHWVEFWCHGRHNSLWNCKSVSSMIKIFGRVVDEEGGSSEGCLKWGGGWWGSLRDLSNNFLKQGWVKAKVVRSGRRGGLKVSPPMTSRKILIIHLLQAKPPPPPALSSNEKVTCVSEAVLISYMFIWK